MDRSTQLARGTNATGKGRRLILIAWLFSAIIILSLAFTYYGIGLLSAARAYVGGEGLWSKAQKDMVYSLARFVHFHNARDYEAYVAARSVILGDRQARVELEKQQPNFALARAGFIQGRNHPDDVDGMIRLFRHFRNVPDIDLAVTIWTRADHEVDHLIRLGGEIHGAVQAGNTGESVMLPYSRELFTINRRLTPLEDAFSSTLADAARKTQTILVIILFVGVSLFLGGAVMFSRRTVRQSEEIETALRHGENQLRELLHFAPLPIVIVRLLDKTLQFANEHALAQFKLAPETLSTVRAGDLYVSTEERDRLIGHLLQHQRIDDWEVRLKDTHGVPFWASMSSQCIVYNGQQCVLTAVSNIDARKRDQQELHHRAFHDELTGLPNRAMFMARLSETFNSKRCQGGEFALMFIDLDRFKVINDELGHDAGDILLQEIARRLRSSVDPADVVARLGGDEFVILVTDTAEPGLLHQTAARIMAAMVPTARLGAEDVAMTVSIGISRYPHDGCDLMAMMKNADLAMYTAKENGRNNFQWYGKEAADVRPAQTG